MNGIAALKRGISSFVTIWALVSFLLVLRGAEWLADYLVGDRDGRIVQPVVSSALAVTYGLTLAGLAATLVFNLRKILSWLREHRVAGNILILASTTLLCFLIVELGLRTAFPGKFVYYLSYEGRPITYFVPYARALAPNFSDTLYSYHTFIPGSPLVAWKVQTNKYGWREPDFELVKPAGVKRLIVLGDSVTYGQSVDYESTHAHFLSHALRLDKEHDWEVLNRGVPGWDGWHQREYLIHDGHRWKPDIVTVNVTMNDFEPITDEEFEAHTVRTPPWSYHLFGKSYFFNMLRIGLHLPKSEKQSYIYRKKKYHPGSHGLWGKDKWWYIRAQYNTREKRAFYDWANALSYPRYLEIKEQCEKMGAYLLVVVYPTAGQTSRKYWSLQKKSETVLSARPIADFCAFLKAHGIPFVNLLDSFREETEHALFADEAHLTEYGQRKSAEAVMKYLTENGVVQVHDVPFWE